MITVALSMVRSNVDSKTLMAVTHFPWLPYLTECQSLGLFGPLDPKKHYFDFVDIRHGILFCIKYM